MSQASPEDALQTAEQRFRRRKWESVYVPRSLLESDAFWALRTATAVRVLTVFLRKRRMLPVQGKPKRKAKYYVENNGRLVFTYREAQERYGISAACFARAIDELVKVGFIDITHTSCGLHKDKTLYALSSRWELFGTPDFVAAKRPKRKQQYGFARTKKTKK